MTDTRVEYVGFSVNKSTREYSLRARMPGGEYQAFTMAISNEAFIAHRVRYQDAPEICFLKLQRELAACGENRPASHHDVTNAELDDFRLSHTPKPKVKRSRASFRSSA